MALFHRILIEADLKMSQDPLVSVELVHSNSFQFEFGQISPDPRLDSARLGEPSARRAKRASLVKRGRKCPPL